MDERRVRDLGEIASSLHDRYKTSGLPERPPETSVASDPTTKRSYEFRRVDATHYVLCAVFATNEAKDRSQESSDVIVVWPRNVWRHGAGHICYEFDVTETPPMPRRV